MAFNVTHFALAIVLVWVVGRVADNGGWVPCGLGFSEQWVLVRAAAYILCGTVCVKQVNRIRAREFRRKFCDDRQRGAAPSGKIIGQWVRQWCETGSVQVKARTRRNTVRSPENIQRVRIATSISAAAFPTLKFVGQKCATNFTS